MQLLLPGSPLFLPGSRSKHAASHTLLLPASKHAAWQLGHTYALLSSQAIDEQNAMQKAAAALGVDAAAVLASGGTGGAAAALAKMEAALAAAARPSSAVSYFLSFQAVVHLLWLAGIAGMCIALGPSIYYVCKPPFVWLMHRLRGLLGRLAPIAAKLGRTLRPLGRALGFYLCLDVVRAAGSYPAAAAPYVALTGHALALGLFGAVLEGWLGSQGNPVQRHIEQWAAACHGKPKVRAANAIQLGAFFALAAIPSAVHHGSQLLATWGVLAGFVGAVIVMDSLFVRCQRQLAPPPAAQTNGSRRQAPTTATAAAAAAPEGQHWLAKEERFPWSFAGAAAAILAVWAVANNGLQGGHQELAQALEPFLPAVAVLGRGALLFAGLVRSCDDKNWGEANVLYLLVLFGSIITGWAVGQPGVFNTAVVFLVLWAFAKVAGVSERMRGKGRWLLWLGFSFSLWRISLILSTHTAWVAALFRL